MEFEYITLKSDTSGYPLSNYSENSPLHRIVKAIYDKGGSFSKITELGCNNDVHIKLLRKFFKSNKYFKSRNEIIK